jgi:hypothetical protein
MTTYIFRRSHNSVLISSVMTNERIVNNSDRRTGDTGRTHNIDGVMASELALTVVDGGFEPRSGQTKDCKIGICCFSAALR